MMNYDLFASMYVVSSTSIQCYNYLHYLQFVFMLSEFTGLDKLSFLSWTMRVSQSLTVKDPEHTLLQWHVFVHKN